MFWTDMQPAQKANLIRELHQEGDSGAILAEKISYSCRSTVSKNAVLSFYGRYPKIAKTHPLGGGTSAWYRGRPRAKASAIPHRPIIIKATELPPKPISISGFTAEQAAEFDRNCPGVSVLEVTETHCRWPIPRMDNGVHLFCGHSTGLTTVYCEHHTIRSRQSEAVT